MKEAVIGITDRNEKALVTYRNVEYIVRKYRQLSIKASGQLSVSFNSKFFEYIFFVNECFNNKQFDHE